MELGLGLGLAKERNDIERAAHHVRLFALINDPSQFIFVDESAKDRNTSRRQHAWQRKGYKGQLTEILLTDTIFDTLSLPQQISMHLFLVLVN